MTHHLLVRRAALGPIYRFACGLNTGWHPVAPAGDFVLDGHDATCPDCTRVTAWTTPEQWVKEGLTTATAAGL